jgi:geranylgeranyl pyrophosphate synthase
MGSFFLSANVSYLTSVHEDLLEVEHRIRVQANGYHPDIGAALELLLSAGGKRLRPTITILIGQMLNAPHDRIITLASAIELLHTATLVHDDMIDGSLLRRGMPTLNSQWSPAATILTGDFLFSCAAKLAAETESVPVIKLFAETLTIIVNGEITQLFNSRCQINRENYFKRIYAKTASLLETSAKSAALIAKADEDTVEAIRCFGYETGMAFQIIDDILDFTSDETTLGKPVGSDLRQGLITLPALHYSDLHPNNPEIQMLRNGNCLQTDEQISRLVASIRESQAIEKSLEEADHFIQRGLSSLRKLPAGNIRQSLEDLAEFITQRKL